MKLSSSIRLEGSYHIVDWFFPRGLRFSHVFCTDCQGPIYFFVIVADNKRCFFLLTSKCGCRSRMYEESSAKCCHFTEKLRRTVAWSTRLSRLVVTRRALWASLENPPPQPLPAAAAAAAPFIEAASSARKDGSPPHALHTRTVRRWYTVSWFTKNGTIIFLTSKIAGCFSNQTTNHVLGIFFSIHWLLVKYNHSPWMITFRSGLSPIL